MAAAPSLMQVIHCQLYAKRYKNMLLLFYFEQESVDISPIQLRRQINMSALSEDDEHYLQLISELPKIGHLN